uniref:Uncharacterized protein n=1 Tax=Avena sativa TaxID=4498 RepID=A0ACD5XJX7_AVESA
MPMVQPLPAAPCSYSDDHQSQQVYTVWMKSLVFNGNGCTVYTPDGGVAFRVDNYGCRGGREVFLMDRAGKTLIRIRRKGFSMFRRWEVGRCTHDGGEKTTQWFSVRRAEKGGAAVTIHVGVGTCYRVVGWCARKSDYRVISGGAGGTIVAEVVRKQTAAGVVLGEDVLTLKVGPEVDHLLVLGLVVVRGLMNRSL